MTVNLSRREMRFVTNILKISSRSKYNYIASGIVLCLCIFGLVIGLLIDRHNGFLIALFFGSLSFFMFFLARLHDNFAKIFNKLSEVINFEESPGE